MINGIDVYARMIAEYLELLDRLCKLNQFMERHPIWRETYQKELLERQFAAMQNYAIALGMRLASRGTDLLKMLNDYYVTNELAFRLAEMSIRVAQMLNVPITNYGEYNENANRDRE